MKGFTIPITPSGRSSIVHGPPWSFSMECMQFDYSVEPETVQQYLPAPLAADRDAEAQVQLAFCDTTAISADQPDLHVWAPADANFHECLLKVRCRLGTRRGFFVVISWVTSDQSLVRGYLQGFGKRLGHLAMTRFDRLESIGGGRFPGARLGARLGAADGVSIYAQQACSTVADDSILPSLPFFLRRHVPALDGSGPLVDDIVEPVVSTSSVADIWAGIGEVRCCAGASDLAPLLPTRTRAQCRSFRTALTITGSMKAQSA